VGLPEDRQWVHKTCRNISARD